MQKIFVILFLICAISCTKSEKQKCYHCESVSAGVNVQKDTCVNGVLTSSINLWDANGNPLSVICTEK
jgi:hypothetical protein